jgi:hypothetical protein
VPSQRQQGTRHGEHDQGLPRPHAPQKQRHHGNRDIGERSTHVRLRQHHQHRDADHGPCFEEVFPAQVFLAHFREILRHRKDEDEFHPFGGLKVLPTRHLDPSPRA